MALLLLLNGVVCVRGGEGGSFYSRRRSDPGGDKGGNIDNRLLDDKHELPAKTEANWRRSGAGRPCGSAGPQVSPLALPFVLDTAKWAPNLCMSVPGLCSSIFFVKWAHFVGETQDEVFCVFLLRLVLVFSLFRVWVPANEESPKLVEFVSNNSYYYC